MGTPKVSTDPFSQLVSREHPIRLDHIALSVDPFGPGRVEPWARLWQQDGQDAQAFAHLLDLLVVLSSIQVRTA
jgi:hypothetical protein